MEVTGGSSENLLFTNKDTFLNLSIFLSIKAICRLRRVCRLFNQWLCDLQNNFAWKIKIQNAFPTTYEAILNDSYENQIQKLLLFDLFVDEGHFVSCFPDPLQPSRAQSIAQIPWLKNTFIIETKNTVFVYNALNAVLTATSPLSTRRKKGFKLNIKDKKIAFIDDENLVLYSIEDNNLVRECTKNNLLFSELLLLPQIYGDYVVERTDFDEGVQYMFLSLSSGSETKRIKFPASECFEEMSKLDPLMYICYQDLNLNYYHIVEVDCLTFRLRQLYSGKLTASEEDTGIRQIKLTENANGKCLHIYHRGDDDRCLEIFDLTKNKIIYSDFYEDKYCNSVLHNPGTPYICRSCNTCEVKIELLSTESEKNSKKKLEETVVYAVKDPMSYQSINISEMKWLNEDIVTFKVNKCSIPLELLHYKPPITSQVFVSVKQLKVIGELRRSVKVFAMERDKVICFGSKEVYMIQLDISYLATKNDNIKKRKLPDDATAEHSAKKPK